LQAIRAPKVQVRYLLVAVIDADSRGKDAAIIESSDPAATLARQERSFDSGGIAPRATKRPTTGQAIAANEALMRTLHIFGTPGVVYLDARRQLQVFAGLPDPQQLKSIVGER
jgi:thiol:disulfide interchange protein DsbG